MRCGCGPLPGKVGPWNCDHASPLFIRQSEHERTLVTKPVVLDAMGRPPSPVRPPQPRLFQRLGFHQKKFPLAQLAEGVVAGRVCAFVQHARPPKERGCQRGRAWRMHVDNQPVTPEEWDQAALNSSVCRLLSLASPKSGAQPQAAVPKSRLPTRWPALELVAASRYHDALCPRLR